MRVSSQTRYNAYAKDQKETYWETVLELPGHNIVLIDGVAQQYPERLVVAKSDSKEDMLNLAGEIEKYLGRK